MMYNTNFNMKKAKFLVILKESFSKYKNDICIFKNHVYMDREYGIYTYTFEDALTFLKRELIIYFCKNNLKNKRVAERRVLLYRYFSQFSIYDLSKGLSLQYDNEYPNSYLDSLFEYGLFYSQSGQVHIYNLYDIISEIAEWNGLKSYDLQYLYPILKVNKEYEHWWKFQRRKKFHTRCWNYLLLTKREAIAGSDPEYSRYLTMRQRRRDHCLNHAGYRKNRNNVPGDWKHYNKCRKQWAKNIKNPSYEKLSRAVWEYEQFGNMNQEELSNG